ncbi:DUF397 domain-containing protein [Streptomyces sp. KM273126]|uniref:DUF397 domain-containing protein n=1 Tax=Streptomyces sp. KM273126 TaxID=2545247 RepID=UPI00104032C5|nr:DUF397 domain-containing protein [Streptomyces sp. KM273126]MBA2807811.1 DUF397 domain-containing protein [Streptomyces sp. KM273126]
MARGITWQKSSFSSGGDAANCLEVAAPQPTGTRLLRESDEPGTVIATTGPGLAALIRHLRDGY